MTKLRSIRQSTSFIENTVATTADKHQHHTLESSHASSIRSEPRTTLHRREHARLDLNDVDVPTTILGQGRKVLEAPGLGRQKPGLVFNGDLGVKEIAKIIHRVRLGLFSFLVADLGSEKRALGLEPLGPLP